MAGNDDPMNDDDPRVLDRRLFLSRSALASGALVVGPAALGAVASGCGASMGSSRMANAEARELLERLERGLGRVRDIPRGDIERQLTWLARPDLSEEVLRQTLEALVVSDVARSLPEGEAVPDPLAQRLYEELPALGRATETNHALLARMPGAKRRQLDARIRREPDLPMEIAGWIDRHAGELGTAPESRAKLRLAAHEVQARLRRQSSNAVIDSCVAKVEGVARRSGGALSLARSTTATAMIDAIWQELGVPSAPGASGLGTPLVGIPPAPARRDLTEDLEWQRFNDNRDRFWSAHWRRPGDEEVRIGSIMMPFGLITCGLLLIVGLIVLIAGAVQNSSWGGELRDER